MLYPEPLKVLFYATMLLVMLFLSRFNKLDSLWILFLGVSVVVTVYCLIYYSKHFIGLRLF